MSKIVNFTCLRIQAELDKYSKTKTIPHDLLDGLWTVDDIESCLDAMPKRYQRWGKKLLKEYTEFLDSNVGELKKALRKEYAAGMKAARTRDEKFSFPKKEIVNSGYFFLDNIKKKANLESKENPLF